MFVRGPGGCRLARAAIHSDVSRPDAADAAQRFGAVRLMPERMAPALEPAHEHRQRRRRRVRMIIIYFAAPPCPAARPGSITSTHVIAARAKIDSILGQF
jgi:hypothetical protein